MPKKPKQPNSIDQEPFHHKVEPGSSFPHDSKSLPNHIVKPGSLRSLVTPELKAQYPQYPENHPIWNYVLSPGEEETLHRIEEGKMEFDPSLIVEAPPLPERTSPDGKPNKIASVPPVTPLPPTPTLAGIRPRIRANRKPIEAARDRVSKRRTKLKRHVEILKHGPQGEQLSKILTDKVSMIPLDKIFIDPDFKNIRLASLPEDMCLLIESMKLEGLKVPITVIEIPGDKDSYYLRSGFRRTEAALVLKWHHLPCIILPVDTPEESEYWQNIVENSARKNLHTYEIAKAAQTMRNLFGTNYKEFALRAGYSDTHIDNLLRAIDRLPDQILERWKDRTPIPIDYYIIWSSMLPHEALRSYNIYAGLHPRVKRIGSETPPITPQDRTKHSRTKTASEYGIRRMGNARFAVEGTSKLDEKTREIYLKIIDFCMGARDDIPDIYSHRAKLREARQRKKDSDPEDD